MRINQNQLVSTLPYMEKEFVVAFDVMFHKFPTLKNKEFENVIHLTVGGDTSEYGDRIPAVWVTNEKKLVVASAISGDKNKWFEISGLKTEYWNNVTITQRVNTDGKVRLVFLTQY